MTKLTITEEEWNMFDHFHNDRGDFTRWIGCEEFFSRYPEVKLAHDNMINSRKIFEMLMNGAERE